MNGITVRARVSFRRLPPRRPWLAGAGAVCLIFAAVSGCVGAAPSDVFEAPAASSTSLLPDGQRASDAAKRKKTAVGPEANADSVNADTSHPIPGDPVNLEGNEPRVEGRPPPELEPPTRETRRCDPRVASSCGEGMYCATSGCAASTGICVRIPAPSSERRPVCGCDGVTYWNYETAVGLFGATVRARGACVVVAKCGGAGRTACSSGRVCRLPLPWGRGACGETDQTAIGQCWGLPSQCPEGGALPASFRTCASGKCVTECDAMRAQLPFYAALRCQ